MLSAGASGADETGGAPLGALLLDDPERVITLVSGSVAVFAVRVEGGRVSGRRRLLFELGPGAVLFGCPDGAAAGLLMAPMEPGRMRVTPLRDHLAPGGLELLPSSGAAAESWLSLLRGALAAAGAGAPAAPPGRGDPLDRFRSAQLAALRAVAALEAVDQEADARESAQREELHRETAATATDDLASVARERPSSRAAVGSGSRLLRTASLVARAGSISLDGTRFGGEEPERFFRELERSSGIRARRVFLGGEWWKADCGPLLGASRGDGRPLALLPRRRGGYRLCDPDTNESADVTAARARSISSRAWMLYAPLPSSAKKPWDVLLFGLRGRGTDLASAALAGAAGVGMGVLTPVATALLVDAAIPSERRGLVLGLALALLGAALGRSLFELAQAAVTVRIGSFSATRVQAAVWDRVLRLRPAWTRKFNVGDLFSRAFAVGSLHERLGSTLLDALLGAVLSLANLAVMLTVSPRLALSALPIGLLLALVTFARGAAQTARLGSCWELQGRLLGITVQLVRGVSKLRVAGVEDLAFAHWARSYSRQQRLAVSVQRIQDHVTVLNQVLPVATTVPVLWMAASMSTSVHPGAPGLGTGPFLAFYTALGVFLAGVVTTTEAGVTWFETARLWERSEPILLGETEGEAGKADPGRLQGSIAVDRVSFRYQRGGRLALCDVTLSAAPGEFVGIVGPSGSGKSTLLRLLLGLETAESGSVYYDGRDLSGLDPVAVRRQLGVVLQSGSVISASILENIAVGQPITLDQAWEAARAAALADDIQAMPMGMHTWISEGGTNLSVGQRQRLLISRALVSRPAALLLDEATSALDNRTQALVARSLESLEATRIVIAHRLSTVRKADRIWVLQAGAIVQAGTFEELAAEEGLFARMMARQML